jgi:hypothetical protein
MDTEAGKQGEKTVRDTSGKRPDIANGYEECAGTAIFLSLSWPSTTTNSLRPSE